MDAENRSKQKVSYPFSGEFYPSRNKKFKELVFFVPFYEGTKRQLLRHIRLVNLLGFDAFAFELEGTHKDILDLKIPFGPRGRFGVKHLYADQIEVLLNYFPQEKIVFSFSNPTASAIEAISRRQCSDIRALICDSGPSNRFLTSAVRLFQQNYSQYNSLLSYAFAPVMGLSWSLFLHQDIQKDLSNFPEDFQILSIRGWKDELIAPKHIDEVFEDHPQLRLRRLDLPMAAHLNGLRDFRDEYIPSVQRFLFDVATEVADRKHEEFSGKHFG